MRYGMIRNSDRYTADRRQTFCHRPETLSCNCDIEPDVLTDIFYMHSRQSD